MKNQKLTGQKENMTYRFEVDDKGNVEFLLATGNDFVKNSMTLEHAKKYSKCWRSYRIRNGGLSDMCR